MANRKRTIEVSVINIAMQSPHSPTRYLELFKEAVNLDLAVSLRSNHAAQISCKFPSKDDRFPDFITGTIDKYYDLKKDDPWFNRRSAKKAEDNELGAVQQLPDELKPSYQSFSFAFHPEKHLFFLISRESGESSLSGGQAVDFLDTLLNHPELQKKFGTTEITQIPSKGALDWILQLEKLNKFEMVFLAPNADDDDEMELKILAKLDRNHAKRISTSYVAREHDTLVIDEETKQQARVAAKNGTVVGYGSDIGGKSEIRSTVDKPLIEKHEYYPNLTSRSFALIQKAREIIQNGIGI
ncbi:MAG: DUF4747 family protein [Methylobacter sp.]